VNVAAADRALAQHLRAVCAEFPQLRVHDAGEPHPAAQVVFEHARGLSAADLAALEARLRNAPASRRTVVVLESADVATTRAMLGAGAADVLPAPVTDLALTLCLQRLLNEMQSDRTGGSQGEVVAMLKAGGGVGATSLAAQAAVKLAGQGRAVCVADLDIQFGGVSICLDSTGALSVGDVVRDEAALDEMNLRAALAEHASGVRLLAAPENLTSLDSLTPEQVGRLVGALQAQFELTILDLPAAWTAWTCRALQLATRIVLVTRLTVPHMGLLSRQLRSLSFQGLDHLPLTLVCNAVSGDQTQSLALKAAERAIGRAFDFVLPDEPALMTAAINQGVSLAEVKRGGKLEKSVGDLARLMLVHQPAAAVLAAQ
jgi:pilus assembly protein CpaE